MFRFLIFLNYAILVLVLIVAGYQCIRKPNFSRLAGLVAMFIIVVLYMIGVLFFSRSPFMIPLISLALPPAGLLVAIYYLTYPERRNRILTVIAVALIVFLVVAYLTAVIHP